MTPVIGFLRGFALVALVALVAACSRTPATGVGNLGPGAAAPGSQQEFLVTVGDRVFFETDSSSLTPTAQDTLNKAAEVVASVIAGSAEMMPPAAASGAGAALS